MTKDLKLSTSTGIGVTTIFTVLLILCLTVFSVLTLASAQADLRLTQKNAQMISAYYTADNEAWNISSFITSFWPKDAPKPDINQRLALEKQIQDFSYGLSQASVSDAGAGLFVEYNVAVDTNLMLNVGILIPESGVYEILTWRMTPIEQAIEESPLSVWQGEFAAMR